MSPFDWPYLYINIKNKKNSNIYFPLAVFTAQRLMGLCKQLKQIIQIEHNIVENPDWKQMNWLFTSEAEDFN